jgi:hypothetical protein
MQSTLYGGTLMPVCGACPTSDDWVACRNGMPNGCIPVPSEPGIPLRCTGQAGPSYGNKFPGTYEIDMPFREHEKCPCFYNNCDGRLQRERRPGEKYHGSSCGFIDPMQKRADRWPRVGGGCRHLPNDLELAYPLPLLDSMGPNGGQTITLPDGKYQLLTYLQRM